MPKINQALFDAKVQAEMRIRELWYRGLRQEAIRKQLKADENPFLSDWVDHICRSLALAERAKEQPDNETVIEVERQFMKEAIEQARLCVGEDGRCHPKVGAVVVKDGVVVAKAYRGELADGEHAEFTALEKKIADDSVVGATVYATLEPCTSRNHPKVPCAKRLVERKVARVVIGMLDPNPDICGKGYLLLREANIGVGLFDDDLKAEIEELNRDFMRQHTQGSSTGKQ